MNRSIYVCGFFSFHQVTQVHLAVTNNIGKPPDHIRSASRALLPNLSELYIDLDYVAFEGSAMYDIATICKGFALNLACLDMDFFIVSAKRRRGYNLFGFQIAKSILFRKVGHTCSGTFLPAFSNWKPFSSRIAIYCTPKCMVLNYRAVMNLRCSTISNDYA
jgi:hypothetical protein